MIDPTEEQRLLADWPGPRPAPEINEYTHVGANLQKPYAGVEHLLARKRTGWRTADELVAAVEAAYPPGSLAREIKIERDGTIYRRIQGHTGNAPVPDENGVLQVEIRREWIPVAMTQDQARGASAAGVRTDYFNGWSWMSRGTKTERDGRTMEANPALNPAVEIAYEPASATEQMRYRAQVAAASAAAGIPAVLPTGGFVKPSGQAVQPFTPQFTEPTKGEVPEPHGAELAFEPAPVPQGDPIDAAGLLTEAQRAALAASGYHTAQDVQAASDEALLEVDGIGPAALEKLRAATGGKS